jgi:hypothetical protein
LISRSAQAWSPFLKKGLELFEQEKNDWFFISTVLLFSSYFLLLFFWLFSCLYIVW